MKTTHAVLLVVLAVIAGGILFVHLHNPAAFDRLLGGSAAASSASSPPALPAKLAAPAMKAIHTANATSDEALHAADNEPAPAPAKLEAAKPVGAAAAIPTPVAPVIKPPVTIEAHHPAPIAAPVFTPMPHSPAPASSPSASSIMNSPSDVINAPAEPVAPAQPAAPSPTDTATPIMSAAPADSMPASAATWTPPSAMPAQPNWTWTTTDGQVYKKVRVIKMDPQNVTILHQDGGATVPMKNLPPEIQQLFNYDAAAAEQWEIGKLVAENLVEFRNGSLQPIAGTAFRPIRYIAVYYSAAWCPPCETFTPTLVKFYNDFKPTHPEFEVLFISEDRNPAAMTRYMRETQMPWMAVNYSALVHPPGQFKGSGIEAFAGKGIPDLVLLDATGRVLSDSYRDGKYVGPLSVMKDIPSLVK